MGGISKTPFGGPCPVLWAQRHDFKQIYLRPIVSLGNRDIGFILPSEIKSKINPYMQTLWDNLKSIQHQYKITAC
ncbi:MAG: hypothetical protein ACMUEM_07110 [Flavobacteriales bacterium AspAUS03]